MNFWIVNCIFRTLNTLSKRNIVNRFIFRTNGAQCLSFSNEWCLYRTFRYILSHILIKHLHVVVRLSGVSINPIRFSIEIWNQVVFVYISHSNFDFRWFQRWARLQHRLQLTEINDIPIVLSFHLLAKATSFWVWKSINRHFQIFGLFLYFINCFTNALCLLLS